MASFAKSCSGRNFSNKLRQYVMALMGNVSPLKRDNDSRGTTRGTTYDLRNTMSELIYNSVTFAEKYENFA
ncbi:hypothetical protein TcasGA2_TC007461 [Tribolium castaneum]|uniref:Uncharacterized protein n=1 Tax=Tribolium castaneum TaxID=7070 RepID=D1ZZG1_TRICA|nr:hypothetical protein TcasGA2_TC007461 [Tribolium castaneum]